MLIEALDWVKKLLGGGLPASLSTSGNLKVAIQETLSGSGGLTNTELRATPVPVEVETGSAAVTDSNPLVTRSAFGTDTTVLWDTTTPVPTQLECLTLSKYASVRVDILQLAGTATAAVNFKGLSTGGTLASIYALRNDLTMANRVVFNGIGVSDLAVVHSFVIDATGYSAVYVYLDAAITGTFGFAGISVVMRPTAYPAHNQAAAIAVASATTPSYATGTPQPLSQTTDGRLRVDLEASSRDLGGVTVIDTADRQGRRLQEQLALEAYEQSMRNLFLADPQTGNRMGFEVR